MEESVLTSVVLPAALFLIMLGMGLSLTLGDFKRVAEVPRAAVVGLICQLLILPLVALGLIHAFGMTGALAVGLMIIAACPGGVTSNLITHVSRGDTALSITLTAITSFITVFSIPVLISYALSNFMGAEQSVELPVLKTILQVVAITIVPVSLGMLVRHKRLSFAEKMERPSRIASTIIFILITVGVILANKQVIKDHFLSLAGVTVSLNVLTMIIGFGAAFLARLPGRQMRTISIESGIQNGTLAIVIATTIIKNGEMALPGGVYSLVMFATGGLMMAYGAFFAGKAEEGAPATSASADAG
ncbi:MAG: bile acid:sodium symporter family protein [Myxococcota bacterium]|jgi:BASS family bile acid:Na+ symporter|nr:bile acid:sodium symporter family protein [Myxococcota bacterium]